MTNSLMNEVSVVFYSSPRKYDIADFMIRAATQSPYTHCALRIGDWSLQMGTKFPSMWLHHERFSDRWKPRTSVSLGMHETHASKLKHREGNVLSRFKTWIWGWMATACRPRLTFFPEPLTCVSLVKRILDEDFGITVEGVTPVQLYNNLQEMQNGE